MARLAAVGMLASCVLDEKGVGIESDSDASSSGGGSAGSASTDASASSTSAGTSASSTTSAGTDGTTSAGTDGTTDDSGGETTGACPNPDVCDGPEQGFEEGIVANGGCGNVYVWAADGVLHVLDVSTPEMADAIGQAEAAGEPVELVLDVAAGEVTARIAVGEDADEFPCNDALSPDTDPFVIYWIATSGTVTMVVDPPDVEGTTTVDVTITDAVFSPPKGGGEVTVASYVWTDVLVGWLPG